jgi:CheY-like chemotaxis protein
MAPQRALQVLIVDDDPGILSALTRLLQRDGHTVQTATNGQEALALLHERGFDLILCDLLMPALDGQTLYGLLQWQLPALCQRIIFLTGDTLSPDSMLFVEQCGQPWIPKPCGIAEGTDCYGTDTACSRAQCTRRARGEGPCGAVAPDRSVARGGRPEGSTPRMTATGSPYFFAPPIPISSCDLPCPCSPPTPIPRMAQHLQ